MEGVGEDSTSQEMAIVSPIDAPYDVFCPTLHLGTSVQVSSRSRETTIMRMMRMKAEGKEEGGKKERA